MSHAQNERPVPPGYKEIFVKSYFHKGLGRRIFAHEYGLQAFRLIVPLSRE